MAGVTNRGKIRMPDGYFRNTSIPTNFYLALCTSATAPTADINTLGQLTQIATGNGYASGGYQLARNTVDFDVLTENDTTDYGLVQIFDVVWTASGGSIPSAGNGARYAVLTDDDTTEANREVIAYWDLTSDRQVSDGQTLTLQNCEIRLTET
jgi:hypothetical protein